MLCACVLNLERKEREEDVFDMARLIFKKFLLFHCAPKNEYVGISGCYGFTRFLGFFSQRASKSISPLTPDIGMKFFPPSLGRGKKERKGQEKPVGCIDAMNMVGKSCLLTNDIVIHATLHRTQVVCHTGYCGPP